MSRPKRPSWLVFACLRACLRPDAADALLGDLHEELLSRPSARPGGLRSRAWIECRAWRYLMALVFASLTDTTRRVLDEVRQDARGAWRTHRRSPGLAVTVVALLAMGVGAATTVAAVVYGVLLRPLPVADADQLVSLFTTNVKLSRWRESVSAVRAERWRSRTDLFDGLAISSSARFDLMLESGAERLDGEVVSDSFFQLLGTSMVTGRAFTEADTAQGGGDVPCVISERLWRWTFASDAAVVGRSVQTATLSCTIVGVASDAFGRWRAASDIWMPYRLAPSILPSQALAGDGWRWFRVIARLSPQVTVDQANEAMSSFDASLDVSLASQPDEDHGVTVVALREVGTTAAVRQSLLLIAALTILVVSLVTANVAGLLLARSLSRERELALRSAIGATTSRLVRQVTTEAGMLDAAGGALGVLIANKAAPALLVIAPATLRSAVVAVDTPIVIFAVLVVAALAVAIGALPALRASDRSAPALQSGSRTTAGPESRWAQSLLVGSQTAIAMPVVVSALMLAGAFARLHAIDPGFDADHLLTVQIAMPPSYNTPPDALEYQRRLVEGASALPGVQSVAIGSAVVGYLEEPAAVPAGASITIEGGRRFLNGEADQAPLTPGRILVSSGYVRTLGLRVIAGRDFSGADDAAGSPPVALINEAMARMHWPGQNPVGRRVNFENVRPNQPPPAPWIRIVGVVSDARQDRFETTPRPQIYLPLAQQTRLTGSPWLLVRAAAPVDTLMFSLRRAIRDVDPRAPLLSMRTMASVIEEATAAPRYAASYVGWLAGLALALAAGAIYSLGTFAAASRTTEVAIRMALGGSRSDVLRLILTQALRPAVAGLAIGAGVALAAARLASVELQGVRATDPVLFLIALAVLASVAAVASYLPARRAARIDPLAALRTE